MNEPDRNDESQPQLAPGMKVIIEQNPHDLRAERIAGTVIAFRRGAGFAGSDLVDVRYKRPFDNKGFTRPFGLCCLQAARAGELIALAERYERLAKDLRSLANPASPQG